MWKKNISRKAFGHHISLHEKKTICNFLKFSSRVIMSFVKNIPRGNKWVPLLFRFSVLSCHLVSQETRQVSLVAVFSLTYFFKTRGYDSLAQLSWPSYPYPYPMHSMTVAEALENSSTIGGPTMSKQNSLSLWWQLRFQWWVELRVVNVDKKPYYRPQRSCGQGNIFTPVCHSFCSQGGRGSASVHAGIPNPPPPDHPPGTTPPQDHTPRDYPPGNTHTPPDHTPLEADSSIRSTSGRYASYWNAFLLFGCQLLSMCQLYRISKGKRETCLIAMKSILDLTSIRLFFVLLIASTSIIL